MFNFRGRPGLDYHAAGLAGRTSCIDFQCKLAIASRAARSRCERRNNGTLFSHLQQVRITFKTRGNGLPVLVKICCLVLDISKEQQICSIFFFTFDIKYPTSLGYLYLLWIHDQMTCFHRICRRHRGRSVSVCQGSTFYKSRRSIQNHLEFIYRWVCFVCC